MTAQAPQSTGLSGMKAIAAYWGRSQATVLKLIQEEGFPARKIAGNWESDTALIDEWRRLKILRTPLRAQEKEQTPPTTSGAPKANPYTKGKQVFGPSSSKRPERW